MQHLYTFVYGRTPDLSRAERQALAELFGYTFLREIDAEVDLIGFATKPTDEQLETLQDRLAGTMRIGQVIEENATDVVQSALLAIAALPEGSVEVGISTWSRVGGARDPRKLAYQIKNALQGKRSVRMVMPDMPRTHIDIPQVIHNKLAGPKRRPRSLDLCFFEEHNGRYYVAQTCTVYDVEAYTKRDRGVPSIDPYAGVLPPRLAQTMINLAVEGAEPATTGVYDAFCGNGRVILEAARWGFAAAGGDISLAQVEATQKNALWSNENLGTKIALDTVVRADATAPTERPKGMPSEYFVVSEPFMGRPLRSPLRDVEIEKWKREILDILTRFAEGWMHLPVDQRPAAILILAPAGQTVDGEVRTAPEFVDRLEKIGYSAQVLASYRRPDAFVRREILRLNYR